MDPKKVSTCTKHILWDLVPVACFLCSELLPHMLRATSSHAQSYVLTCSELRPHMLRAASSHAQSYVLTRRDSQLRSVWLDKACDMEATLQTSANSVRCTRGTSCRMTLILLSWTSFRKGAALACAQQHLWNTCTALKMPCALKHLLRPAMRAWMCMFANVPLMETCMHAHSGSHLSRLPSAQFTSFFYECMRANLQKAGWCPSVSM